MFVDIGIIAILLIGLIVGIVRGTAKSIIKMLSLAGALVLTWYLTPFVMKFVFDTDMLNQLVFGETLSLKSLFAETAIASQMESSFFIKALASPLTEQVTEILTKTGSALTYEQCLPYVLAVYSATVFVSFLVYLVVRLLIMIIAAIIKAIFLKYKPRALSRIIGGILGVVNSVVITVWILLIGSTLVPMPSLTAPMTSQTDESKILGWTYEFVQKTYNDFLVKDSYIEKAIKAAEKTLNPGSASHTHSGVYVCDGCGDSFAGEWSEFLTNYEGNVATVTTEEYYVEMSADVENNMDVKLLCATIDDTISLRLTYDADSQSWTYAYSENDGGANLTATGTFASFSAGDSLTCANCDFADFTEKEPMIKSAIATIVSNANSSLSEKNAGFTMANLGLN